MPDNRSQSFEKIRFVFLDRDGVLNRKLPEGQYVFQWADFTLLPGVEDALARLKLSGRKLILITNQRCVALGLCSEQDVRVLHEQLQHHLEARGAALDAIYVCPHGESECGCRKPKTGMFEQAFRDFPDANRENGIMLGDSLNDIEAGLRIGMKTVFVLGDLELQNAGAAKAAGMATMSVRSLPDWVEQCFCDDDSR